MFKAHPSLWFDFGRPRTVAPPLPVVDLYLPGFNSFPSSRLSIVAGKTGKILSADSSGGEGTNGHFNYSVGISFPWLCL